MGRLLRSLCLGVLLVAVAGCFQATEDITVRADGSGTFRLRVVMNLEAFAELGASLPGFADPDSRSTATSSPVRLGERALASGGTVSARRDGERLVVDAEVPFDDPADLDRGMAEMAEALDADSDGLGSIAPGGSLRIDRRGDLVTIVFRASEGGMDTSGFDMSAFPSLLREDLKPSVRASITAPGSIRSSNADEVVGRTARWDLLRPGAPTELRVTADAGEGVAWLPLAAAVACVLLLTVVAVVAVRRVRVTPERAALAPGLTPAWPGASPPPSTPHSAAPDPTARAPDPLQAWPDRPS